jgi:hypothetical protein
MDYIASVYFDDTRYHAAYFVLKPIPVIVSKFSPDLSPWIAHLMEVFQASRAHPHRVRYHEGQRFLLRRLRLNRLKQAQSVECPRHVQDYSMPLSYSITWSCDNMI